MSSFEERKDAFEKKFAHDEELAFKVEARTCKLFGIWAAQQMGLEGADAEAYAREVVGANLEEAGFADVKRKVIPDLQAKGLNISEHVIDSMLEKFVAEAKIQIMEASENS
jgi:hypothetical protein